MTTVNRVGYTHCQVRTWPNTHSTGGFSADRDSSSACQFICCFMWFSVSVFIGDSSFDHIAYMTWKGGGVKWVGNGKRSVWRSASWNENGQNW